MRDLLARLRSLLTTGLPQEDLYDVTAWYPLARTAPRSVYVQTVRGYASAQARCRWLNDQRLATTHTYLATRRPA
jgi:hypothetical protein